MDWNNAVVGALIGGALTSMGFMYKRRVENHVILNRSLYQLLNLYRSIRSAAIRPSAAAKIIVEALHEIFPESKGDPSMAGVEELYGEMLTELFKKTSGPEDEGLLQMYLGAVENLSAVDPVLAYRLSANAGLKRYLVAADEETANLRRMAAAELSEEDMKYIKACHEEAAELASKESLHELKIDLLLLSIRCGVFQFIAVVRRVCRKHGLSVGETESIKANIKALLESQIKGQHAET